MELLPAWKNETEYAGLDSAVFKTDLESVQEATAQINRLSEQWAANLARPEDPTTASPEFIKALRQISAFWEKGLVLGMNLHTFVSCETSLDARNAEAQKTDSRIQKMMAGFETALKPFQLYLSRCDENTLQAYLNSDQTRAEYFYWQRARQKRDLLLSSEEEKTLAQFREFGLLSWGDMYRQISGQLRVTLSSKGVIGLAEAIGYLRSPDSALRQEAWVAIRAAWKTYETPVAAVLNNLAGFRLEEYAKRSHTRKIDFLEFPLLDSNIQRETLNAMMQAVSARGDVVKRALYAKAKCLGKKALDPWDGSAPSPRAKTADGKEFTFERAMDLISEAFASVTPEMGAFSKMMLDNGWIDARVLPNKRNGAYCKGFPKSNTPRVFQTFLGSSLDVSTLAHELGHAWHSWVMRDLPLAQQEYPMTLAETASIFAETVLAERMFEVGDADTRFSIAWNEASHAIALLANIPMRFDFEKDFYHARAEGSVSAAELGQLADKAFRKWYGSDLTQTDTQFWMTTLHFSIAEVSFYNFPYTFGYLFSLGIYARRTELGDKFPGLYREILRDTGRMSAEDLIQKHLGLDIRQSKFWLDSLKIVEGKVALLERLLAN